MLDSPLGTKSTFWEGFGADGDLAYGGNFISMSHGWSTAPTSALTFYVLGTAPEPKVGEYRFVPHPGDLTSAEGRITLPQGQLGAAWVRDPAAGTYTARLTSPAGTTGQIGVPKLTGTNVTVSVNGEVVWRDGTFTPRTGVHGASQDGNYVYLTGVEPGTYDITASGLGNPKPAPPSVTSEQLPAGYTYCADEGGQCSFSGTRRVAYGAGTYAFRTVNSGTACTTDAFRGDPVPQTRKACYIAPDGPPPGYVQCASEGATCSITGNRTIAYGANGVFVTRLFSSSTSCNNDVFGDPIGGVVKACYVAQAGPPPGGWTQCASDGSTCQAAKGQPIAYGAVGRFRYVTATGDTACAAAGFGGDPVPGEPKACYTRSAATPPGFATTCAAEGATCAFSGQRTVAYGTRGGYLYRTFSGGTPCTTAAFGADPVEGVAKSCYLTP
jgi:hypothetical protein